MNACTFDGYYGPDLERRWRDARTHLLCSHDHIGVLEAEIAALKARVANLERHIRNHQEWGDCMSHLFSGGRKEAKA